MNSVPPDDDFDIEAAWRESREPIDDAVIDRITTGALAELDLQPAQSSGFYWTLAASILIAFHLAIAASWSSSFDWGEQVRGREKVGDTLLVRREMIESLEAELQMSPAQPNHSQFK